MWDARDFMLPTPKERRELLTGRRLRTRRNGAILLAAAAAVSIPIGFDSGAAAPWWFAASPCLAVAAVGLWIWSGRVADRRNILPALTSETLDATVVKVTREVYRQEENSSQSANRVYVEGDFRGIRWKATIADAITEPSLSRFDIGSRWRVKGFEGNPDWVALAPEHDDVIRQGYWLTGPTESEKDAFFAVAPGPGSDIALVTRRPGEPPPIWRRPSAVRRLGVLVWVLGALGAVLLGLMGWLVLGRHRVPTFIDDEASTVLQLSAVALVVIAPVVDGVTARRRWSRPWWSVLRAAGVLPAGLGAGEVLRVLLTGDGSTMTGFLFIGIGAVLLLIRPVFTAMRPVPRRT